MSISFKIVKLADLPSELKHLRERKRLSQRRFAERCGYNPDVYSRWERGIRNNPRIRALQDWAQALGFDLQLILSPRGVALDPPGRASSEPAPNSDTLGAGSLT
jgi:transcriptional regulator with XRE-family HTH domain